MPDGLIVGTMDGLAGGLGDPFGEVRSISSGTPNGALFVSLGSQIVYVQDNGQYYMGLTNTTWIKLGSVS